MKQKIISNTYLRDVEKYQIKIFLDEEINQSKVFQTYF